MKKLIAVILVALLAFCGVATAEMDYSSMTDDELHAILDGVRAELARRETVSGDTSSVFEEEGVTLYYTGDLELTGSTGLMLSVQTKVVNNSQRNIKIFVTGLTVNGLVFNDSWINTVPAGQTGNMALFFPTNGEFESVDIINDLMATYKIYDADTNEKITEIGPITVHFNVE